MITSAQSYPVSQLFDTETRLIYVVPRYQRAYTWGKFQWEQIFDDLISNDSGYFLGSIICINQANDAIATQELELVDGQQRLLTLSLLFASLYDALNTYCPIPDNERLINESLIASKVGLKRKLVLENSNQLRLNPQFERRNEDDYKSVLCEAGLIQGAEPAPHAGNRQIFRAYRYFQDRLKKMLDDETDCQATISMLINKINQACMVKIEVVSHADAYILFESLNNRGIPLTAVDMIKNKLLSVLDCPEGHGIDHYYQQWITLLSYLGEDYKVQERFFRHYYNAFKHQFNEICRVPLATRTNLVQIYETLINHNAQQCLEKIIYAGSFYSQILLLSNTDESLEKPLKDLERIQGAPSHLLLLHLLVRKEVLELGNSHIRSIVEFLVRFFVRRNLTDIPATRELDRLFIRVVDKIRELSSESVVKSIKEELKKLSASDALFRESLSGNIYLENSNAARFVLCDLAEREMTRESHVDLWQRRNNQYIWSIEHIFPQGQNIPQCWIDMVSDGDEERAKDLQDEHVQKLGNLTISGYNRELGNLCFKEKRDRTNVNGHSIGYKNGLALNNDLAKAEHWTIGDINDRTDRLVNQVAENFSLATSYG